MSNTTKTSTLENNQRRTDSYRSDSSRGGSSSSRRYSPNRRSDSKYNDDDNYRRDAGSRERRLYDNNKDSGKDYQNSYRSERREYDDNRKSNSSSLSIDNRKDMNETLKRKLEEHQTERKKQKKSVEEEDYLTLGDDGKESKQEETKPEYSFENVAKELWTDEKDFILKPTSVDQLIEINKIHILRREERENKLKEFELKKKEKKEKKKSKKEKKDKKKDKKKKDKSSKQDDEMAGPKMFDLLDDQDTKYEVPLLPGEGAAIAEFIQRNERIPRRGEVGLSSDQISNYENLGYVMSGSRHARMNAIRIMKENEVYMQEEKKRLALLQKQERSQRENKIISQFRDIAKKE